MAEPTSRSPGGAPDVELDALRGRLWLHRSWAQVPPWGRVAANGLVVVGDAEALLVDTPWNDARTEWLVGEVKRAFGVPVTEVIVTHAHDDNLGGLAAAHRLGATSYAADLTLETAKATGKPQAQQAFTSELDLNVAGAKADLFYPGPGHTRDNIVVYFPEWSTLFGGCLIKDLAAQSLGNTGDADVPHWAGSVDAVSQPYPQATLVVPGHGEPGGFALLAHTRDLAHKALQSAEELDSLSPTSAPSTR